MRRGDVVSFNGCEADEDVSKHQAAVFGVLCCQPMDQKQGRKALVLYQPPTKIFFVASFQTWRRVSTCRSTSKVANLDDAEDDHLLLQSAQQCTTMCQEWETMSSRLVEVKTLSAMVNVPLRTHVVTLGDSPAACSNSGECP